MPQFKITNKLMNTMTYLKNITDTGKHHVLTDRLSFQANYFYYDKIIPPFLGEHALIK